MRLEIADADAGAWQQGVVALCRMLRRSALAAGLLALAAAPARAAEDAGAWLAQVANAARQNNYVGIVVWQKGPLSESSRLVHYNERGVEVEKLVSLDGPPREVVRGASEVRSYFPEAKVIRVEPPAFRNAFPALSSGERKVLAENFDLRKGEVGRIAGLVAQAWLFEPKDTLRFGHKFWLDANTGLLLKAQILNERGEVVEQIAFSDISIGVKSRRELVKPSWAGTGPDWKLQRSPPHDIEAQETGWIVGRVPPGFVKIAEGYRTLRDRPEPVAHLVYSDGLTAISVFVERVGPVPRTVGPAQQGGVNMYIRPVDDCVVTVLGEVPGVTVRQMAHSVSRR